VQDVSKDEPGGRNLEICRQQESQNILARASALSFPSRFYTTTNGARKQRLGKLLFESASSSTLPRPRCSQQPTVLISSLFDQTLAHIRSLSCPAVSRLIVSMDIITLPPGWEKTPGYHCPTRTLHRCCICAYCSASPLPGPRSSEARCGFLFPPRISTSMT